MNTASVNLFNEAKAVIAGGVDSPVRAFGAVGGVPRFIVSAKGAYLKDADGNELLDFVQSWGPLIFGHCDSEIESAVIETAKKGLSFGAPSELETLLAKEIISIYDGIEKIRFVSSGTEATMSAIRLARAYAAVLDGIEPKDLNKTNAKREHIIKFAGCYHGHSDSLLVSAGSGMATFGSPSSPGVVAELATRTLIAQYNDISSVYECLEKAKQKGGVAAIIIEPLAGNMGFVPAEREFLKALRELCDKEKIVLICDEVMSGFRAAINGAQAFYPECIGDITTFGKVIGGGMPVGAFGANAAIMDLLSPNGAVYQAGTLSGNPVAMAAGLAAVRKLRRENGFYERLENLAKKFTNGLKEICQEQKVPLQTDFRGSMFGYFFAQEPVKNFTDAQKSDLKFFAKFHQEMLARGVYLACSQFETGFICASMGEEEIDFALNAADAAIKEAKAYE